MNKFDELINLFKFEHDTSNELKNNDSIILIDSISRSVPFIMNNYNSNSDEILYDVNVSKNMFNKYFSDTHFIYSKIVDEYIFSNVLELPIVINEDYRKHSSFLKIHSHRGEIYFSGISIALNNYIPAVSIYIHEIMHALTLGESDIITDYLDIEFFSIFFEKVILYDLELYEDLEIVEMNRWIDINNSDTSKITLDNANYIKMYYKSNVLATYLFSLYKRMSPGEKEELFTNISRVFNSIINIKDFYNIYNINFNNKSVFEVCHRSLDDISLIKRNK